MAGQYRREMGKPDDPVHSTIEFELRADGTATWMTTTKFRESRSRRKASGSWTWQDGVARIREEKLEEGPPAPPGGAPTLELRLAADGRTLLLPDGSRLTRQD